ncbi:hypothetical protein CC78DRAFT_335724 [Lojkania enalia]|uniref:Uncharacterized protein n=1 Tax=Lojkania enalia TaxID=147567 RepID=A0A9P4TPT0_9PLEO|nr:hypothetical protein CC78DRAFT_335724 [Didymosphaeria enalia]
MPPTTIPSTEDADTDTEFDAFFIDDAFERPSLPVLSATATVHPRCCLALSAPLLAHLQILLPCSPDIILSIGSGYGLLEAHLISAGLCVIGIEVLPSPNRCLPPTHHRTVSGTRFLHPLAGQAKAWLFVYPRRVGLVQEYMNIFGTGGVQKVIWMGPQMDWDEHKACFAGNWDVDVRGADEVGGKAWDLIAVATQRHTEPA